MIRIWLKLRRVALPLALLGLVAVLVLGCDTGAPSNPGTPINSSAPTNPPPPPPNPPPVNPPPNQTATVGTWTFALGEVATYTSLPGINGGDTLKPKNTYVIPRMK